MLKSDRPEDMVILLLVSWGGKVTVIFFLVLYAIQAISIVFILIIFSHFIYKILIAKAKLSKPYIALICCTFFFVLLQVSYGPIVALLWCDGLCGEKILQSKIETNSILIDEIYSEHSGGSVRCGEACLEALKNKKIKYVEIRYLENVLTERKDKAKIAEKYRYKRYERVDHTQIQCNKRHYTGQPEGTPYFSIYYTAHKDLSICVTENEIENPTSNYLLSIQILTDYRLPSLLEIFIRPPKMYEETLTNIKNGNTVAFSQYLEYYAPGILGIIIPSFFMNGQLLFERPFSPLTLSLAKVLQ